MKMLRHLIGIMAMTMTKQYSLMIRYLVNAHSHICKISSSIICAKTEFKNRYHAH